MRKLFFSVAGLGLLAVNPALADPAAMVGISFNIGGTEVISPGITAKIISSDKEDKPVGALGVSFFPLAENKFGVDLSAGYNFDERTALIGYDLLNQRFQASGGWVNTADKEKVLRPSDMRFKRSIRLVGETQTGIKLYAYQYIWSEAFFVGVMAQDLLADPAWAGAVHRNEAGYFLVDYSALGLRMARLEEWEQHGFAALRLNAWDATITPASFARH